MILKVNCVMLQCDNCKEGYTNDHSGFSIYLDESSVCEEAGEDDWHDEGDKQYCPNCYTIGDDDELIIKTERAKP